MIFETTPPTPTFIHLSHSAPSTSESPGKKKIPSHHRLMWAVALEAAHASEYNDIPVQLLYIKFVQDTSRMNYHLVATVTPLMQGNATLRFQRNDDFFSFFLVI